MCLRDSVLIELPIPHIESTFYGPPRASSSGSPRPRTERRVFWARLSQSLEGKELRPQDALAILRSNLRQARQDRRGARASSGSFGQSLLKLDPRLPEARRATILKQLDASFTPTPAQIADFGLTDLRSRTRLLTPDFRGAVFFLNIIQGQGQQHADRSHRHGPRPDRAQPHRAIGDRNAVGARSFAMVSSTHCARACGKVPPIKRFWALRSVNLLPSLRRRGNPQEPLGKEVARDMTGLMVVERPNPRYQVALKDSRRLTLWFDASKKERPIYWIELTQGYDPPPVPADQYDRILGELGQPDYNIAGRQGAPLGALLIKIDPSLSPERTAATR